jgi:asparagine synthase (glutamine-hydrolysing)
MCGIIGIAGQKTPPEGLDQALKTLQKRGPDEEDILAYPQCVLGHTRLAVIDLSPTGHQPMRDAAKDTAIIFNGEIYNYKELRRELEQKGHVFVTQSDTEIILKSYLEYGEHCPEYLDGQFAFGIWDNEKERLFLARDRFGEKPLYIARAGDSILFASEIKALLATGKVRTEIDLVSLDNYLALMYVPPWRSIYKDITPLPPAHYAIWEKGTYTQKRYWSLKREPITLSVEEAAAKVREMLTDSVRSRMVADVEVGAFLSGGIDSSIIVRLAQQISPRPLKTFSAGFEGFINELPFAQEIATLAKTEHHPTDVKDDLLKTFLAVSTYFDEPFADSSNMPTSLISKYAREQVKVALSGDGGDELFWGYGQYTHYNHLPKMQTLLNLVSGSNAYKHYKKNIITQFDVHERKALLLQPDAIEEDPTSHVDISEAKTPLEQINLIDMYMGLPGDMLTKVDRASMMHSLEVRSPFLNHKLAQLAYNLPPEFKTDGRRGKLILEKAFGDILPPGFFTRKKQGFGGPVKHWLMKPEFKKLAEEYFGAEAKVAKYLNMNAVQGYVERFYDGEAALGYKVWTLFTLEAWLRSR